MGSNFIYFLQNVPIKSKTETKEEKFQRDLQTALLLSQHVSGSLVI